MKEKMTPKEMSDYVEYDPDTGMFRYRNPVGRMTTGWWYGTTQKNRKAFRKVFNINGVNYTAHRMAWAIHYGEWPSKLIDHIDGNPENNRISNLRDVSHRINSQNLYLHRMGRSAGVEKRLGSEKWRSSINIGEKDYHLGVFNSEESAMLAYLFCSESRDTLEAIETVRRICLMFDMKTVDEPGQTVVE